MARRTKGFSRMQAGEYMFTNPREAAHFVRGLIETGADVTGSRAAMHTIGLQPHHAEDKMAPAEAIFMAQQTDESSGPVEISYEPTASSKPSDPRTSAAGYDAATQRLMIQWGDGGTPYYYYGVTPQEWDAFQESSSPGRYINSVLNYKNYGPIGSAGG
jgi:hypothetical protein